MPLVLLLAAFARPRICRPVYTGSCTVWQQHTSAGMPMHLHRTGRNPNSWSGHWLAVPQWWSPHLAGKVPNAWAAKTRMHKFLP